jgi:uncharacterized protein YcfJ
MERQKESAMKRVILVSAIGFASVGTITGVSAQEVGRVISSTPVIQQVAVPRQVCDQPMTVQPPSSGGGALVGALVGGLLGNTIGQGGGRLAATGVGAIAGAAVGDQVERRPYTYAPACTTQTTYENRTIGYDVQYEYAGRQYSTRLPYDPGQTIRLQVSPAPDTAAQGVPPPVSQAAPPVTQAAPPTYQTAPPVYQAAPAPQEPQGVILREVPAYPAYSYGPPAYYYPAPYPAYPRYYYPPVSLSLGFGFVSHGHRH